jgi:PIN domain nuclease of toxin-antitoxin system
VKPVLLDTHTLIWVLFKRPEMSASAWDWINDADDVYVSVVSIYEIDYKRLRGGTRANDSFLMRMPANMPKSLPSLGFKLIDISADTAWRAATLPIEHSDPWDRMLVSQAIGLNAVLVSADRPLKAAVDRQQATSGVVVF